MLQAFGRIINFCNQYIHCILTQLIHLLHKVSNGAIVQIEYFCLAKTDNSQIVRHLQAQIINMLQPIYR